MSEVIPYQSEAGDPEGFSKRAGEAVSTERSGDRLPGGRSSSSFPFDRWPVLAWRRGRDRGGSRQRARGASLEWSCPWPASGQASRSTPGVGPRATSTLVGHLAAEWAAGPG